MVNDTDIVANDLRQNQRHVPNIAHALHFDKLQQSSKHHVTIPPSVITRQELQSPFMIQISPRIQLLSERAKQRHSREERYDEQPLQQPHNRIGNIPLQTRAASCEALTLHAKQTSRQHTLQDATYHQETSFLNRLTKPIFWPGMTHTLLKHYKFIVLTTLIKWFDWCHQWLDTKIFCCQTGFL